MTMSLRNLPGLVCGMLIAGGVLAWSGEAKAQAIPASIGLSNTASGTACFSEYYGGETNTCGSWVYWIVPMTAEQSGSGSGFNEGITVSVYSSNVSTNPVSCYAYSMDLGTNTLYQSGTQVTTSTGRTLLPLSVYLPNDDPNTYFSQVVCAVWPGSAVYGVNLGQT